MTAVRPGAELIRQFVTRLLQACLSAFLPFFLQWGRP
jgi:hypothetical protein